MIAVLALGRHRMRAAVVHRRHRHRNRRGIRQDQHKRKHARHRTHEAQLRPATGNPREAGEMAHHG
jgi:hypothetical protein